MFRKKSKKKDSSSLPEDLSEIKFALKGESYVREKLEMYMTWFAQLEAKIRLMDETMDKLRSDLDNLAKTVKFHSEFIKRETEELENKSKVFKEQMEEDSTTNEGKKFKFAKLNFLE